MWPLGLPGETLGAQIERGSPVSELPVIRKEVMKDSQLVRKTNLSFC